MWPTVTAGPGVTQPEAGTPDSESESAGTVGRNRDLADGRNFRVTSHSGWQRRLPGSGAPSLTRSGVRLGLAVGVGRPTPAESALGDSQPEARLRVSDSEY